MLVNNAGVQRNHDWIATPTADRVSALESEIAVNLTSPLALTALFLDDLVAADEAAIVNLSSLLALTPKRSAPVYCATKAGIRAFGRGLAYQLESHPNLRVVEVVPPLVDTGMTAGRGSGKISPAEAANEIVRGLERDQTEILVGKARLVTRLHRWLPGLVARMLKDG
ncbi:MAG: SDR family NAD(P)-dependent oxidoreductase [Gemmatimonadales bacterium]